MSVLCTTVIEGLDASTYDQMVGRLGPVLRSAPGFVNHVSYPAGTGWTVSEIWDSEPQFRAFFGAAVSPNLPPGTTPSVLELHSVMAAEPA